MSVADFLNAVTHVNHVGGYIAVAPGNVVAFAADSVEDAIFSLTWDDDLSATIDLTPPEWLDGGLDTAREQGVTVLDIRGATEQMRQAVLMTVATVGMPHPAKRGDIAGLADIILEAGGTAANVPTDA